MPRNTWFTFQSPKCGAVPLKPRKAWARSYFFFFAFQSPKCGAVPLKAVFVQGKDDFIPFQSPKCGAVPLKEAHRRIRDDKLVGFSRLNAARCL